MLATSDVRSSCQVSIDRVRMAPLFLTLTAAVPERSVPIRDGLAEPLCRRFDRGPGHARHRADTVAASSAGIDIAGVPGARVRAYLGIVGWPIPSPIPKLAN